MGLNICDLSTYPLALRPLVNFSVLDDTLDIEMINEPSKILNTNPSETLNFAIELINVLYIILQICIRFLPQ